MMSRREWLMGVTSMMTIAGVDAAADADERLFLDGLVLPPGPMGRCDDDRIGGPVVRWDDDLRLWRMWYYARDRSFPAQIAPAFGSGSLALAHSKDGFAWERIEGPEAKGAVMTPSAAPNAFDSTHVATGDVLRHEGEWLLAYHGGNHERPTDAAKLYLHPGYVLRIGFARSSDGLRWNRIPGPLPGGAFVEPGAGDVYVAFPSLVRDDARFLLYYTTVDKQGRYSRARVATSTDLRHWSAPGDLQWENDPLPFEGGGTVTRDIVRSPRPDLGRWLMTYTARDGRAETGERRSIGLAASDDARVWRRVVDEPIVTVGRRGNWDSAGVANPRLVITESDVRVYYYGWSDATYRGHPFRGIGCVVSRGRELRNFRRLPASL